MAFKTRIQNLYAHFGTQRKLAIALGVTTETVNRWLNTDSEPRSDVMLQQVTRLEKKVFGKSASKASPP